MSVRVLSAFLSIGLLSSVAFAQPAEKNGNFRRGEALEAVGAKTGRSAALENARPGAAVSRARAKGNRVLLVEHGAGKVDYVKAPLDKRKPVSVMSDRQVKELGLITQEQARKTVKDNNGLWGDKGKVRVRQAGLSSSGDSFAFEQSSGLPKTRIDKTYKNYKITAKAIKRTQRIEGSGESATVDQKWERIEK